MNSTQPPIGIDLGTTNSVVAYVDETGRPTTIPNRQGELITPSALLFDPEGLVVGREAIRAASLDPSLFAECFKRDLGKEYYHRPINGHRVPPEVLSAFLLQRLKVETAQRIGTVDRVVVTVPAFFDESRRRATQEASKLAGLEVLDIINEPTAAALAYGYHSGFLDENHSRRPLRVLVYDLGGGTFDVTILEIRGRQFRAIATDGDMHLGGRDFDQLLVDLIAHQFHEQHGIDPREDPADAAVLWNDAQNAKHTLSERTKATLACGYAGRRCKITVSRQQFEEEAAHLLQRTSVTMAMAVKEAGLSWSQIDRVLLVGGSSRMPMVQELIRKVTKKTPDTAQSLDELVAHGAALYAALVQYSGNNQRPTCELINVNSHSLGVVGIEPHTRQKTNVILIPKNTPLPHRVSRQFRTARKNQKSVKVPVVEGESADPDSCIALGECVVTKLPPGLDQGTPIQVEYSYQANGRISVSASIPSVRTEASVEIEPPRRAQLDDLATWIDRLQGEPEDDLRQTRVDGLSSVLTADMRRDETVVSPNQPPPLPVNNSENGAAKPPAAAANGLQAPPVLPQERLANLYRQVGMAAAAIRLPDWLSVAQRSVIQANSALNQKRHQRDSALRAFSTVAPGAEEQRVEQWVNQAENDFHVAQQRYESALANLGRECARGNFVLPALEQEMQEIVNLQEQIDE